MRLATLRAERLRSQRLTAPAGTVVDVADHLLATQAQEFWGGRWALAVRARGSRRGREGRAEGPTLRDVDDAFDRGELVRSWTMRGTIHIIRPRDLAWMLALTGERQFRAAASRHRALGLDDDAFRRAEQYVVLAEEWIGEPATPSDPLAECFVRYIDGHGPAGVADFAWWSGLPLGAARQAAESARTAGAASARLVEVDDGLFASSPRPRRDRSAPGVIALPPFDEYFLSYADRSFACAVPEHVPFVATGGAMRPIVVADGEVVATWTHSLAVGRHHDDPLPAVMVPGAASDDELAAALERYRRFIVAAPGHPGE